jgi:ADP-heptose:LPS heptosyltransferase
LPRWHFIWDGNPRMARPDEAGDFQTIRNGGNARPYIEGKQHNRWIWREFECPPGEIYFSDSERFFARDHRPQIVIEPTIKNKASPNKQWGATNWQSFAALARAHGFALTQMGPSGTRPLRGVQLIHTPDFRRATAVLANARAYVGPDGGLMHAAAALGVPAVIIRGAFVSYRVCGYAHHRNLFTGEGLGCGMRTPCGCCARAMAAITPEMVLEELKGLLG